MSCALISMTSSSCSGSENKAASPKAGPPELNQPATGTMHSSAPEAPPPKPPAVTVPQNPEVLQKEFENLWKPWIGDLGDMRKRRFVRALVTSGTYLFYYEDGHPKGLVWEQLEDLQKNLNHGHPLAEFVTVVPIPVPRGRLIPDLLAGHGDFIATDLSITPDRAALVDFTNAWRKGVNEIVVTGPGAPTLTSLDSLSGQEVAVRLSSSYDEHLEVLNQKFVSAGRAPVRIRALSEILEADDILDMLASGVFSITIMDEYKARFWAETFPAIQLHSEIPLDRDNRLAWATRPGSPEFIEFLDGFLAKHRQGTLLGNIRIKRYLSDSPQLALAISREGLQQVREFQEIFEKFGTQYGYDWLQIAAQAYQESGLDPKAHNRSGATGLMQIRPTTARDKNVGIHDISQPQSNVHAGVKYMRFLADRYFNEEEMHPMDQWMFTLAAYNAGPARIQQLRREANQRGLDQNKWVDNVETVAAQRIGRETVRYVSDIAKYFLGYKLTFERQLALQELKSRQNSARSEGGP